MIIAKRMHDIRERQITADSANPQQTLSGKGPAAPSSEAVRFAAKLDFEELKQQLRRADYPHGRTAFDIPPARLFDESL